MPRDDSSDDEVELDPSAPEVFDKYKSAADVANRALAAVIAATQAGKRVLELCEVGDKFITDALRTVYPKAKLEKGIAFPTCISPNNCLGHLSPLPEDSTTLQAGDLVKIDLGVHLDGYICVCAYTIVCPPAAEVSSAESATPVPVAAAETIKGRAADLIQACYTASECALRLLKPGNKNTQITEVIAKVAKEFSVNPIEGVVSHQMKRFVIDGNKQIALKHSVEHKVPEVEIELNEVYAIDILMSSGEGKARELDTRTTIYKRDVDQSYQLKMQASRQVLSDINTKFPTLPFTMRMLDEKRGRLGMSEIIKHNLVVPYPVLYEKNGQLVAHLKVTALVLSNGIVKLAPTQGPPSLQSEHSVTDAEIKQLLETSLKRNQKKKAKKTKKTKNPGEVAPEAPGATEAE